MPAEIHIVPEIDEANGVWRVATLLASEHGTVMSADCCGIRGAEEVWVHGMWLPRLWLASLRALRGNRRLVRMTHGSLSPVYLKCQSPLKKRLAAPVERYFLRRADVVVATCVAEAEWIRAFEPRVRKIEVIDIKRFFNLPTSPAGPLPASRPIHILYLGRRHPLKGLRYLEEAVAQHNSDCRPPAAGGHSQTAELRIVSNAFGEEKERVWDWCDVLALPTLSENFGLVIAEALERGKRVITTDGAPAWEEDCKHVMENVECKIDGGKILTGYSGRLVYLKGFRDGADGVRVALLKYAISGVGT